MKMLRLIRKGVYELYAILDGEVYRLSGMDPIEVLERYSEGKLERLGERVELDLESLLMSRDPGYKVAKPFDPVEVWGAGITYGAARARYVEEDVAVIRGVAIYALVYESDRPELFLKDSSGRRCVAHQDPIAVRSDSKWTLPEPELAVILGGGGKILGYTIANDVTARDIEAENPLYLPQAKIYNGCCSFGPYIVSRDEIKDPHSLKIEMRILRRGRTVFEGKTSTSMMRKRIDHILRYLFRDNTIPPGTLLMTGTGIVPGKDISLEEGDEVEINIEGIGTLINPVIRGKGI
jgi:2-dehydro-3-deoxy-D-arabinonate dehydratase